MLRLVGAPPDKVQDRVAGSPGFTADGVAAKEEMAGPPGPAVVSGVLEPETCVTFMVIDFVAEPVLFCAVKM